MADQANLNEERGGIYGNYGGGNCGNCNNYGNYGNDCGCMNNYNNPYGGDCCSSCCNNINDCGYGYGYGFGCGLDGNYGYNPYMGFGYGMGWSSGFFPGYVCGICLDEYLIQYACQLRGESVRIILEHSPSICGRLVQINLSYLSVSVDGTVAYIPFCEVVAIIPI